MIFRACSALVATTVLALGGCNATGGDTNDGTCDPLAPECEEGRVCAQVADGEPTCLAPIVIRGQVVALVDDSPIEGALVQAVDINGAAVGTSAMTDADGRYELTVGALRDAEGAPIDGVYTLRVQAMAFQEFPTALRPALPLDAATAVEVAGEDENTTARFMIDNALTVVKLIALPGDSSMLGSIVGTISADINAGILVIADGDPGTFTGFSDAEGVFTIFNVPAGTYTVSGFAAGVQLGSVSATLTIEAATEENPEPMNVTEVALAGADRPLSTVTGSVQIVDAPGGALTSVVLAVESTFVEEAARGAVPPGLRVGGIEDAFTIEGVPDGRYVVLAAFENDNLVRDPDQSIGGTAIVTIDMPPGDGNDTLTLSEGFKVTEALNIVGPGANGPEQVDSLTPVFEWADDSSEDGYEIRVFDAFGNLVWTDEIGSVTGSATVTHAYAGPALEPGVFYQFRVTSFRDRTGGRSFISTTEDLEGVFYFVDEAVTQAP